MRDRKVKFSFVLMVLICWQQQVKAPEERGKPDPLDVQAIYLDGEVHRRHHPFRSLFHHKPKPERPHLHRCGLGAADPADVFCDPIECWLVYEYEWKGEISWILDVEPDEVIIFV